MGMMVGSSQEGRCGQERYQGKLSWIAIRMLN